MSLLAYPPESLVVHHSASARTTTVEEIRSWHRQRGWDDIGYHWVIDRYGAIRVGRPAWIQGAHTYGHNSRTWGVCVTGDNTRRGYEWVEPQEQALHRLVESLRVAVPELKVVRHCDLRPTECPGRALPDIVRV